MTSDLEKSFDKAMMDLYHETKKAGYSATRFHEMLCSDKGLATARKLIHAPISEGYTTLIMRGRPELTVEAFIFDHPEWHPLFSVEDLEKVKKRLKDIKYPEAYRKEG